MSTSLCSSCHRLFRQRLQLRIFQLQHLRRSRSTTTKESQSWYNDTAAPVPTQLHAAEQFFLEHQPRLLWTDKEWRKRNQESASHPDQLIPEVAFLGRSNVGKSSLLNALVATPALNRVGPRPGKTIAMRAWALARTKPKTGGAVKGMDGDGAIKCAVLDMPGYGHKSHSAWGNEIMKYLSNRKQLKRTFVVFDAQHGLLDHDLQTLKLLRSKGISCQIVASKCDKLKKEEIGGVLQKMWNQVNAQVTGPGPAVLGEVLAVGSLGDGRMNNSVVYSDMKGVDEVRWAVLRAIGLEDYAVRKFSPETTPKLSSSENLQGVVSSLTKMLKDEQQKFNTSEFQDQRQPAKSQPVQPEPTPFTWPAKLRQPASTRTAGQTIIGPSTLSQTPRPALEPTNHPSLLSELDNLFSSFEPSPTHVRTPQPTPLSYAPSISRSTSRLTNTISPPKHSSIGPGSPSVARGMDGLLDMISHPKTTNLTSRSGKLNLKSRPSRIAKSREKVHPRQTQSLRQRQRLEVKSDTFSSNLREPWTGPSVGGMAELEAMMHRMSQPAKRDRKRQ